MLPIARAALAFAALAACSLGCCYCLWQLRHRLYGCNLRPPRVTYPGPKPGTQARAAAAFGRPYGEAWPRPRPTRLVPTEMPWRREVDNHQALEDRTRPSLRQVDLLALQDAH